MKNREYKNYDLYIKHQKTKTLLPQVQKIKPEKYKKRVKKFKQRFSFLSRFTPADSNVLCLGARRGEEIEALMSLGYKAQGIDLVAFPPHVIAGDFHNLPFDSDSFDLVYSNAVDHVFDLEKFAKEALRVVKRRGFLLFHLALDIWSEEMSLGMDSSLEMLKCFKDIKVVKDEKIKAFGGGLNHILFIKKLR